MSYLKWYAYMFGFIPFFVGFFLLSIKKKLSEIKKNQKRGMSFF